MKRIEVKVKRSECHFSGDKGVLFSLLSSLPVYGWSKNLGHWPKCMAARGQSYMEND